MQFFRFMLILSFLGSGLCALCFLCMGLALPMMQSMDIAAAMPNIDEQTLKAYDEMIHAPQIYYLLMGVLYAVSLAGAIAMWNAKRVGLHMYSIAQIVMLALPTLFLGSGNFDLGNTLLTALFIVYYSVVMHNYNNLQTMQQIADRLKRAKKNNDQDEIERLNDQLDDVMTNIQNHNNSQEPDDEDVDDDDVEDDDDDEDANTSAAADTDTDKK